MPKPAKKKAKVSKKAARVVAKPRTAKASAKTAKKKAAKASRPAARKTSARKIDPLNRKQYTSVTPLLTVSDVRRAADFYAKAFGFSIRGIMDSPQGAVHGELRLRDTTLMLSPESTAQNSLTAKSIGNTPATLYVLVDDVDDVFESAVAAGGNVLMPVADMFWGDRCGMIADPDGNKWMVATHKSEPTEAEMMEAMRKMSQGGEGASAASASAGSESEY